MACSGRADTNSLIIKGPCAPLMPGVRRLRWIAKMTSSEEGMSARIVYGLTAVNVIVFAFNLYAFRFMAASFAVSLAWWAGAILALGGPLAALGFVAAFFPRRWGAVVINGLLGLAYGFFLGSL